MSTQGIKSMDRKSLWGHWDSVKSGLNATYLLVADFVNVNNKEKKEVLVFFLAELQNYYNH